MTKGRRALKDLLERKSREEISRDCGFDGDRRRVAPQVIGRLAGRDDENPTLQTLKHLRAATGISLDAWADEENDEAMSIEHTSSASRGISSKGVKSA